MKIANSSIVMSSQHSLVEQTLEQESFQMWNGNVRPAVNAGNLALVGGDSVQISDQAKQLFESRNAATASLSDTEAVSYGLSEDDKQKIRLLEALLEKLTGRKIRFLIPEVKLSKNALHPVNGQAPLSSGGIRQAQGWGLRYDYFSSHYEEERLQFNAHGLIKTADGREIAFTADLGMTRQFAAQQSISVRAGDALIDPLVLNFDAPAASLTTTKYSFDLDSDGKADQISFAGQGSGFLAFDLNNDGVINNGKELFGPDSGNGFADLAQYDTDGNQWIDENDAIYDKLRIWTKDAAGNDQLFALGEKGIGAIYLGNVSTEFAMKDAANNQQGQLRSSGIFLRENGTAGTVQQVDLTI